MSSRKPILVVHDDPSVIGRIRPALESLGYDVTATSSDAVESVFRQVKPNIVILAPCVPAARRAQLPGMLKAVRPGTTVFQLDSLASEKLQRQLTHIQDEN
jgi:CheY-like chemotaxis protein